MAKINDYIINDFSGGLVTNKSDFEMDKNEFVNTLNCDLEERGKLKRRRGMQQVGQALDQVIDDSYSWYQVTLGSAPTHYHFVFGRSSGGAGADFSRLFSTYLTVAAAVADTTLTVADNANLAASGSVTINGDVIAYTGKSGGTGLTGVTGILAAHPAFSLVNQFTEVVATAGVDTRSGVYFAILNNLLFVDGLVSSFTFDGATATIIGDADEPSGLFAVSFRDRIYVGGGGASDAAGTRNGDPRRISFSDAGDSTSWDINNFFDVEDERGESITGLRETSDNLIIFKTNSIWLYNESTLIQGSWLVGAYSNTVIQKSGNSFITCCPNGVFETNGVSSRKISDPMEHSVKQFTASHHITRGRVVVNTFSGQFKDKYYLYIGNITEPETLNDVVLVWDTVRRNWTIHDSYTSIIGFSSLKSFGDGTAALSTGQFRPHDVESFFASDTSNRYFRLFENRFLDASATRTYRGGDIIGSMKTNSLGSAVSTVLETAWTTLGTLSWKKIARIRATIEQGNFQISYRLDQGTKQTDWVSLGNFQQGTTTKKLRIDSQKGYNLNEGYRIKIKVTSNSLEVIDILNLIAIEDIETVDKIIYAEYGN